MYRASRFLLNIQKSNIELHNRENAKQRSINIHEVKDKE